MGDMEVDEHNVLFDAIANFVRSNCNFESSIPINAALDEMFVCNDLQTMFAIPLQHKLFNMESSLKWVLFLSISNERAVSEGDKPFTEFSSQAALMLISQVYDISIQENIWTHFENSDDEEEEEEFEED